MHEAAAQVISNQNFFAFTKTNTQAKTFICQVELSRWIITSDRIIYNVRSNRFLRGMVRLLTASMLQVGRHKISPEAFSAFFNGENKCGFSVPSQGLYLKAVNYPENYFP
jgi:tRNA pseudouridine38-40 synthase